MTTIQLGQQLCGYLNSGNVNDITAADATLLVTAINAGLGEMQLYLPRHRFTSTLAFGIAAPRTESVTMTAGASGVSNTIITAADGGKTLFIGDDPAPNRVVSPTAFWRAYAGTAGVQTMTLYDDAVLFEPGDLGLRGSGLFFVRASDGRRLPLNWCEDARLEDARIGTPSQCWTEGYNPDVEIDAGTFPRAKATQSAAMRGGAWMLRMWPLPDVSGSVEVDLLHFEGGIVLGDLARARQFRFSPIECAHLITLAAEALLPAGKLAERIDKREVAAAALRARNWLTQQNSTRIHGVQTIKTREGF